jgi:hypothetical protein
MKRRNLLVAAAIAQIVTTFGCVSTPPPDAQTPRTGKVLVERLPVGMEGVELVADTMRIKPGFQWVKQPDGTVIVQRIAGTGDGGPGLEGTWSCDCDTGPYSCEAVLLDDTTLKCKYKDCLSCKLSGKTKTGSKTAIIAY